jgi:hypothetical protein
MEDIWDDNGNETDIADREWNKLQEVHGTIGYREGVVDGQDSIMQKGFDIGYKEGSEIGLELGIMQGMLSGRDDVESKLLYQKLQLLTWDEVFQGYLKTGEIKLYHTIKEHFERIVQY